MLRVTVMKSSQLTEWRDRTPRSPTWSNSLEKTSTISWAPVVTPKLYWPRLQWRLHILFSPKLTILSISSLIILTLKKNVHEIRLGNQRWQHIDKVQKVSAPPKPAIKEKSDIPFIQICLSGIGLGFVCSTEGSPQPLPATCLALV